MTKTALSHNDNEKPASPNDKNRRRAARFQVFAIVLGILIFSFVVYMAGYRTILESLGKVGWGFLVVVALNGSRQFLRSFCVFLAVPERERSFKYRHAVEARLGGEAAGIISFTGGMVSEATKAALLKNRLSLSRSITTIILDNLIYILSVACMVLTGSIVMLTYFGSGSRVVNAVLGVLIMLVILGLTGLIVAVGFEVKPLSFLLKRLSAKSWMPKFLVARRESIHIVEKSVIEFYKNRRMIFFLMLAVNFVAHSISVIEITFVLSIFELPGGITIAFVIESLTKVINFSFGFIPGNLGVYEGGASVIFHTLGLPVATGVALALVRRGAILSWTAVGIIILIWRTLTGRLNNRDRVASGRA